MNSSKIFLYFCLFFIGGIFLNSIIRIPQILILGFLILGILLISVFWRYKKIAVIGFSILFLVFGIWRHQTAELKITNNQFIKHNNTEQNITLFGTIIKEPDIRENNTKLTIESRQLTINNQQLTIFGKVLVTTNKYPEYQYGDKLEIFGELNTPHIFEDFNYKDYLAKQGIYSTVYYPEIELKENERKLTSFIYGKILELKNKARETIYRYFSPPQSSILGAIILGDKGKLSEKLKEKLNIVGIRHITCISGMHIIILSGLLMGLALSLGLWRGQAFYFSIIILFIFILMVGAPPSAIRAGIMGGLFLFAQKIGRLRAGGHALTIAAAFMLLANPLLLGADVGFQLSFLATFGIIYLMPFFQGLLKKIPNFFQLRNIIAMTFSAQIFTLPILIYNFGYFSQISPISNVLIVPLLPYLMVFGFIFILGAMICPILGSILSLPLWLLLTYIIKIVDLFSQIPWAAHNLEVSWIWLVISYLILGFITYRLNKKQKLKFLSY